MKKNFISLVTLWALFFSISWVQAQLVDQNKIEKQLVLSRYEVSVFYWEKYHKNIDKFFIKALWNKDRTTLNKLYTLTAKYMKDKDQNNLNKKEILINYLLVRSYYELNYRMK